MKEWKDLLPCHQYLFYILNTLKTQLEPSDISKYLTTINICRDLLNGIELGAEIVHIPEGDTFQAEKKTCYLLQKGVVAIFGPRSKSSSEHIKHITDSVEIPYIETRWNYRSQNVIGR